MTPEQQRIAIAEFCGLFRLAPLRRTSQKGKDDPLGTRMWYCENSHGGAREFLEVPFYTDDLNAMHKAEKVIRNNQRGDFSIHLQRITGGEWFLCYNSTAVQRAEALLRTIGKWEETK